MSNMNTVRSVASQHRSCIFRSLLSLPHDEKYLGYLLTQKAKEIKLVDENRKTIKGHTLSEWAKSSETDGRNTPNAWACTAAVHLILDYKIKLTLSSEELDTFAYYLSHDTGEDDAFYQAKALIGNSIEPVI